MLKINEESTSGNTLFECNPKAKEILEKYIDDVYSEIQLGFINLTKKLIGSEEELNEEEKEEIIDTMSDLCNKSLPNKSAVKFVELLNENNIEIDLGVAAHIGLTTQYFYSCTKSAIEGVMEGLRDLKKG